MRAGSTKVHASNAIGPRQPILIKTHTQGAWTPSQISKDGAGRKVHQHADIPWQRLVLGSESGWGLGAGGGAATTGGNAKLTVSSSNKDTVVNLEVNFAQCAAEFGEENEDFSVFLYWKLKKPGFIETGNAPSVGKTHLGTSAPLRFDIIREVCCGTFGFLFRLVRPQIE